MPANASLRRGVILAATLVLFSFAGCAVAARLSVNAYEEFRDSEIFHQGRHGRLSEEEMEWARTAWKYFVRNYNAETGLVNAMNAYPMSTMWHVGDHLAALHIARDLGIVDEIEFDQRLSTVLDFLNGMELASGQLPNKSYHAQTGAMTNSSNRPMEMGWSAVDIGRLLVWLRIISDANVTLSEYIDKAVLRWDFCDVIDSEGSLQGSVLKAGKPRYYQEGRLGYEEYAAMGFRAWGFDPRKASKLDPLRILEIEGVRLAADSRDERETGILAPLVSTPFLLLGLEFNWDEFEGPGLTDSIHTDALMARVAQAVYDVQEARYKRQRVMTARTDHPVSKPPYYLLDSIFANGYSWNTISDQGDLHPELALVSTRAAFGMWSLWDTRYSDLLIRAVAPLHDNEKGWFEGRYEKSGAYETAISATTNALVLQALHYKLTGKAFRSNEPYRHWAFRISDEFRDPGRCWPSAAEVLN